MDAPDILDESHFQSVNRVEHSEKPTNVNANYSFHADRYAACERIVLAVASRPIICKN